ncbi:G-type lectin S-receptor-like serine/threonine-protein kinase [Tanacetum coccineum]
MVANRENPLLVSDTNSTLIIDNDGNLRILNDEHKSVWSTKVRVQFNETIAKLTDVGDFGSILWESFDYPGNSLLPGMKFGTNGKTKGKNLMTSWRSDDDPTPGKFVVGLSSDQPPLQEKVEQVTKVSRATFVARENSLNDKSLSDVAQILIDFLVKVRRSFPGRHVARDKLV